MNTIWLIISGIATGAPIWVWGLLATLLALGLRARKTRSGPIWPYFLLPFLGLLAMQNISGLQDQALAWGCFSVAYGVATGLGHRYQNRRMVSRAAGHITVSGEWLTMLTIMIVFWANFVHGVLSDVAPMALGSTVFQGLFALILGGCAGCFLGRSLRIITWRPTQAPHEPL